MEYKRQVEFSLEGSHLEYEIDNPQGIVLSIYVSKDKKDLGVNFSRLKKHVYTKAEEAGVIVRFDTYYRNSHLKKVLSVCEDIWSIYKKGGEVTEDMINRFLTQVYVNKDFLIRRFITDIYKLLYINRVINILRMRNIGLSYLLTEYDYKVRDLYNKVLKGEVEYISNIIELKRESFLSMLILRTYFYEFYTRFLIEDLGLRYEVSLRSVFREFLHRSFIDRQFDPYVQKGFYKSIREIILYCLEKSKNEKEFNKNMNKFLDEFIVEETILIFSVGPFTGIKVSLNFLGFKDRKDLYSRIGKFNFNIRYEEVKENLIILENFLIDNYRRFN